MQPGQSRRLEHTQCRDGHPDHLPKLHSENSGTCLGICCKDGVVVAAEKLFTSKMVEMKESARRCHALDFHAGICISGYLPDGRNIMTRARNECKQMRETFAVPITGGVLAKRTADYMHVFTKYGSYRPFGSSAIIASYGDDGPQLFVCDPSGTVAGYHACALGKGKTVAKSQLEALDFSTLTCAEAVKKAAAVLYDVHDSAKDRIWDVEFSWVCDASGRRFVPVPQALVPPMPVATSAHAAPAAAH